jgi:Helix-turn-helix domain
MRSNDEVRYAIGKRPKLVKPRRTEDAPIPSPHPPSSKGRRPKFSSKNQPKVSDAPPHTQFAVIPSRAITDPRINQRKPLLLLLGALGIHASAKGLCYPSQRRLAALCGRSPSWAGKYLRELQALGYIRRLVPPKYRGTRSAWRLQILWRQDNPIPTKEASWEHSPWCRAKPASSDRDA